MYAPSLPCRNGGVFVVSSRVPSSMLDNVLMGSPFMFISSKGRFSYCFRVEKGLKPREVKQLDQN